MTVKVSLHTVIIFREELREKIKATKKYCSAIRGSKIMKRYWRKNTVPVSQYPQATLLVRAFTEPQPICCKSLEPSASHLLWQWVIHGPTTITFVPTRNWLQVESQRRRLTPRRGMIQRTRPNNCAQRCVSPQRQHQGSTHRSTRRTSRSGCADNLRHGREINRQRLRQKLQRMDREMMLLRINEKSNSPHLWKTLK